jgi:hypothetical protein
MEHWTKHIFNRFSETDIESLTETVDLIVQHVDIYGYKSLDLSILLNKFDDINVEHLATFLRVTNKHKDNIPHWQDGLTTAIHKCHIQRLDINDLLYGII